MGLTWDGLTWEETLERAGIEGWIEGKIEGKIEGRIEALRHFVLLQVQRRFGTVPDSVRRKVEALDSAASLTEVSDKLLDAGSIDEMGLE